MTDPIVYTNSVTQKSKIVKIGDAGRTYAAASELLRLAGERNIPVTITESGKRIVLVGKADAYSDMKELLAQTFQPTVFGAALTEELLITEQRSDGREHRVSHNPSRNDSVVTVWPKGMQPKNLANG